MTLPQDCVSDRLSITMNDRHGNVHGAVTYYGHHYGDPAY